MLEAVENLESVEAKREKELRELEIRLCSDVQNAAPLMDLCNRIRFVKVKLALLKNKIVQYSNAEENLRLCISEYLDPSSHILQGNFQSNNQNFNNYNGNFNYNQQQVTPKRQMQGYGSSLNNHYDDYEIPLPEKKTRQTTPKNSGNLSSRNKSPALQMQYQEVDETELATLDTRSYGHISLNDIRELHQYIWDFFQNPANENKVLTQKQLQDDFPKIRTLRSTLRFLKTLKRIDLTKDGNVKCALS